MLMLMRGRLAIVMLDWVLLLVQVAYLALGQYRGRGPHRPGYPAPVLLLYSSWEEPLYFNFERSEIRYKV